MSGADGVGLTAVNGALVAGATMIAFDITNDKLEKARAFGATHVVNFTTTDPVDAVPEITGRGADSVFNFVGVPAFGAQGIDTTGPCSTRSTRPPTRSRPVPAGITGC